MRDPSRLPLKKPGRRAKRPPPICPCHDVVMHTHQSFVTDDGFRIRYFYCPVLYCNESAKRVTTAK